MRRITPLLTTALLAAALGAIPAPAAASRSQESLFQDDANLLFTSDARRNATLNELRGLGVDVIRVNVVWNQYAPAPQSKKRPKFDATNPNAYRNLNVVTAVVNGARVRGMAVQLTPTVPGPAWA